MHHEASLHDQNCFLTLTYEDAQLPADGSVSRRAMQLFFKRLRKAVAPTKLSFFYVGEYGDGNGRPHYHAIVFNYDFPDKTIWRRAPSGHYLYRSAQLEKLWTFGNAEIGTVTHQSAGYVARYCLKKVNGQRALNYERPHPVTGELFKVMPEFAGMSTRPAIGARWYQKYHRDAFPSDFVVIDGAKRPVPKFYKKLLTAQEEHAAAGKPFNFTSHVSRVSEAMKRKRQEAARTPSRRSNETPDRLATREELQTIRAKQLKREV